MTDADQPNDATVAETMAAVEERMAADGKRLTPKRRVVLESLLSCQKALSAYELVDYCKQTYGLTLPAVSMYRILDFLEQQGLAHKLNLAHKYIACVHIEHCSAPSAPCGSHGVPQFLVCTRCSKVKEVAMAPKLFDGLQSAVQDAGFALASPQLELSGVCTSCLG